MEKEKNFNFNSLIGQPRSENAVIEELQKDPASYQKFRSFPSRYRQEIIDFLCGSRGLDILYDSFFQHVMNPETHRDRLEGLISCLLGQPVQVLTPLPREGEQLADSGSFVVMDILVRLTDQSIINIEMQKIGYQFPEQRAICYLSDVIMREYNRLRSERQKHFTYQDLAPVYLFIIMENSPEAFRDVPAYIHRRQVSYDSGVLLPGIEHITYISLDKFRETVHHIGNELDAWLTFFSTTEPKRIIELVDRYPAFADYYRDIALFRRNPKVK